MKLFIADELTTTGYREATLDEIMTGAKQALSLRVRKGALLTSPRLTADYLITRMATLPHEVFAIIYIDLCVAAIYVESLLDTAEIA